MPAKIFTYPAIIKEIYLDSFGHMNNANYLILYEEARWDLLNLNGYGIDKIKQTGLGPTILEINIKYLRELKLRDTIEITSQMTTFNKKISTMTQKMLRNGIVCCEAVITLALFNLNQRKIVLPTAEWLNAIGASELSKINES